MMNNYYYWSGFALEIEFKIKFKIFCRIAQIILNIILKIISSAATRDYISRTCSMRSMPV